MVHSQQEKGAVFLLIIFLTLIVLSVSLFFALKEDPVEEIVKKNEPWNVLFVLHDDGKVLFTDILSYYQGSERGALFDIPGNTGVIIEEFNRVDRVDSAYSEKGIDLYKTVLEQLTGVSLPFTVEIGLKDFASLTDLLGGLKIFIDSPVDTICDEKRILLPSGAVYLDGDKIVSYLKYRFPEESDADVQERMQNVVKAFFDALNKKASFILNKDVFATFKKFFVTNVSGDAVYKLFSHISSVDGERLNPQTVSGSIRTVDDKQLLFPTSNGQLIKDVFKQVTQSLSSVGGRGLERVYVLEIQNGTQRQGLARNTGLLLSNFGYDVLATINAERQDYQKTVVIDHIGNAELASSLAGIINCKNIETAKIADESERRDADSLVDFTIILGADFDGRTCR